MSGNAIRLGDQHYCPKCQTTTKIVIGSIGHQIDFKRLVRAGDKTDCGASVVEGMHNIVDEYKRVAVTGCRTSHGGVLAATPGCTYFIGNNGVAAPETPSPQAAVESAPQGNELGHVYHPEYDECGGTYITKTASGSWDAQTSQTMAQHYAASINACKPPFMCGLCRVDADTSASDFAASLFQGDDCDKLCGLFQENNPYQLKGGYLAVVANEPLTDEDHELLGQAKDAAHKANASIDTLTPEEHSFLLQNYSVIDGWLNNYTTYSGAAMASVGHHIGSVKETLEKIGRLYQYHLTPGSKKLSEPDVFYFNRQKLFNELDNKLSRFTLTRNLYSDEKIKQVLGMYSTRSITHQWKKTGEFKAQELTKMTQNMAKAAKWLKAGGYIGIALSGMDMALQIDKACSTGRESECTKAEIVDTSSFVVGTGVGAAVTFSTLGQATKEVGTAIAERAAIALGIGLAPETLGLSLAIVVVGLASWGVSELASKGGKYLGKGIYWVKSEL